MCAGVVVCRISVVSVRSRSVSRMVAGLSHRDEENGISVYRNRVNIVTPAALPSTHSGTTMSTA